MIFKQLTVFMAKINAQRGIVFQSNETKNQFFFTADDQGFDSAAVAGNNANNLVARKVPGGGVVDAVTRAEYDAWYAEDAPAQLTAAQGKLGAANKKLEDAKSGLANVGATATAIQKSLARKAINNAKLEVDNAQLEVDTCQEAVDGLNAVVVPDNTTGKTAQQLLDEAQAAFDAATAGGNADDIAAARKILTVSKARLTRESKKA